MKSNDIEKNGKEITIKYNSGDKIVEQDVTSWFTYSHTNEPVAKVKIVLNDKKQLRFSISTHFLHVNWIFLCFTWSAVIIFL